MYIYAVLYITYEHRSKVCGYGYYWPTRQAAFSYISSCRVTLDKVSGQLSATFPGRSRMEGPLVQTSLVLPSSSRLAGSVLHGLAKADVAQCHVLGRESGPLSARYWTRILDRWNLMLVVERLGPAVRTVPKVRRRHCQPRARVRRGAHCSLLWLSVQHCQKPCS